VANMLSYRVGLVDKPQLPLDRVAALGITHLEISLPEAPDVAATKRTLADAGLKVGTVTLPCKLTDPAVLDTVKQHSAWAAELGALSFFTSVKSEDQPLDQVYAKLRQVGDIAREHGLRVGMETHPDLCHNGELGRKTMEAINHPAIGINYDTANVYYYNEGIDTVEEVKKAAAHVISVHLKDTDGGFKSPNFPPFGRGVVDFAAVFAVLAETGFSGPYTMELEGASTTSDQVEEQEKIVAECVGHLKKLGLV